MSKVNRREPRFEVVWKARLSYEVGQDYCPMHQVSIHNASVNGLRIISQQAFTKDQCLCIRLVCKHSRKLAAFTLKGHVVYCEALDNRMGFKLGLSLTEVPDSYRQLIDQMEREGHPLYD